MATARAMAELYDNNRQVCKYVHSTSKGHEAIQIATGLQLRSFDYVSPYYRDDSLLLALGFEPYQLMLQLLAKADDPFSGGRSYYCHPSSKDNTKPVIIHQSSATGMQAIPTTGVAQGIQYLEWMKKHLSNIDVTELLKRLPHSSLTGEEGQEASVVVCSLGDNSITEGEVSEAFQFAALKQLPIIYLVQDNNWGISVTAEEARSMDAFEYIDGFKGISKLHVDGSNFEASYQTIYEAIRFVRRERKPLLVHASVPLLNHHTSGVRKEFYRSKQDLEEHAKRDPFIKLKNVLLQKGYTETQLDAIKNNAEQKVHQAFEKAKLAPEPDVSKVATNVFSPTLIKEERGERMPANGSRVIMVDAALHAIEEIMEDHPECLFYGQDVGRRLGGVFREAATLAEKFGDERVFNTAIQEAYIIGSAAGLSAVGLKPIVEVQFADYIYPGFNQLVTEISKSCYLSNGKFPVQMVLRVPTGAYSGGGPYHSGSIESTLLSIKGIKVCYPSNAADIKGLMKGAFYDQNPVIMLEHKGLYWSKVGGTEEAKTIEPAKDYILPLGKAKVILRADDDKVRRGETTCTITYGMGVYWAKAAAKRFPGQIEIIDLRTLYPLDEDLVYRTVKKHGHCLVLTEEQQNNSFAEALAFRITYNCFQFLDKEVEVLGALNLPAVPINLALEAAMLPNPEKVAERLEKLLFE
ncbi:MAG: alpha-ketoacid dehydrogenase subunit alpha/beta [Ilyomonas sp.]